MLSNAHGATQYPEYYEGYFAGVRNLIEADLDVAINGVWVCRSGAAGESQTAVDLGPRQVDVTVDLKSGSATATVWTNDLTHAYVHENSAYST